MHIKRIAIKNFQAHRDSDIRLFPLTAFVGPCGGGKSALFDAVVNLSMSARGRLSDAFSPYPWGTFRATKSWGSHEQDRIGYRVEICPSHPSEEPFVYELQYRQDANGAFNIPHEKLSRSGEDLFDRQHLGNCALAAKDLIKEDITILGAIRRCLATGKAHGASEDLVKVARGVSRVGTYRLDPYLLQRPSNLPPSDMDGDKPVWLGYHGENLASVLYQLNENSPEVVEIILAGVQKVFPYITGFSFDSIGGGRIGLSVQHEHHSQPLVAPSLSDGTLIIIGYMTLLHMTGRPDVMSLEEPENGLTPGAVRALYESVVQASTGDTASQILLSSHSPYVLCEAWNGNERDFVYQVKSDKGRAIVTRVTELLADMKTTMLKTDGTISIRFANQIMSDWKDWN